MLLFASWLILAFCTYHLSLTALEGWTQQWGGLEKYLIQYAANKGDDYSDEPVMAIFKTMFVVVCLVMWPVPLYTVAKGYFVDQVPILKKSLEDKSK